MRGRTGGRLTDCGRILELRPNGHGERARFSRWWRWKGRRASQDDEGPFVAFESHSAAPILRQTFVSPIIIVAATVKWFNPDKGFGFVAIADGSGDAFLPLKAVQAFGRDMVTTGERLKVFVGRGEKGQFITKIVAVDDSEIAQT
jgi:cold shock CspA family protein